MFAILASRGNKVDSAGAEREVPPVNGWDDLGFLRLSGDRRPPDPAIPTIFQVIHEPAIGRLPGQHPAVPSNLYRGASGSRYLPDLGPARTCRREIDPLAVARPVRNRIAARVVRQAMGLAAAGADRVDLE